MRAGTEVECVRSCCDDLPDSSFSYRALVRYMQENGTLLAMPGTHQGKSGWYEYESPDDKAVIVKYEVTEEVRFVL